MTPMKTFPTQWPAFLSLMVLGAIIVPLDASAQPAITIRPCEIYALDHPEIPPWDDFTNCPLLQGTFQNENWRVTLDTADRGIYTYEGFDRRNGDSIYISSRDVQGSEDYPTYTFRNGDTLYQISFRSNDHNTIRLQVSQGGRSLLNTLLTRI